MELKRIRTWLVIALAIGWGAQAWAAHQSKPQRPAQHEVVR